MNTKTKIVVTIGPACDCETCIADMIEAGASIFRFNTKHNSLKWHSSRIARVRRAAKKVGVPVAILLDLRGSELRVGTFKSGQLNLESGETVWLRPQDYKSDYKQIIVKDLNLVKGVKQGAAVYLDDGFLKLRVTQVSLPQGIQASVIEGGILKDNKSINFPGAKVDLPSLVKRDLEFLSMPAKQDIDFVGHSFVRSKADILALRKVLSKQNLKVAIVAKIENRQAIDNFEEILAAADAIMVARGDLGVEIALQEVPFYQKMIIQRCREEAKPVIVATQMLESMITKPRPTRAETSDVANAVYDATDALMLSGETAAGKFPIKTVQVMNTIADFSEQKRIVKKVECQGRNLTEVISFSALKVLNNRYFAVKRPRSFVIFTDTGLTVRFLSSLRPTIPIFAITDDKKVRDQLCLSYGVVPFYHQFPQGQIRSTKYALQFLKQKKQLQTGDRVILIYGKQWGVPGGTNTIRVEEIQ
ncbi:pyruvate kinase [Patescibacteria group bacterium]|nr:pyruvate kinase [Patescibacteria group bacterium]MBU1931532.1 pyruvate kinase [Patescibacteria group bacterium]